MKLQVRDHERDYKIVKLRKKGLLYKDIAEMLGITKSRVGQLYRRILGERRERRVA